MPKNLVFGQARGGGFNAYLKKTISIRDTNTRKSMKENFYHGILLGLFGNMDGMSSQMRNPAMATATSVLISRSRKQALS